MPTGVATSDGGTGADKAVTDHVHSRTHDDHVVPETSSASTSAGPPSDHAPAEAASPHTDKASHDPTNHAGSGGARHHRQAGRRDPHGGTSSGATKHSTSGGSEPNAPVAIGHVSASADRVQGVRSNGAQGEGDDGAPQVASRPSSRVRMPDSFQGSGPIEQVAGVLRFPAVLLGVILLFMAFQQRADRRDHMLAHAPVGTRQETLEFR
jgi:hypothetical protein